MNIETPSLILDRAKVEGNCARLRGHLARHGDSATVLVGDAADLPIDACSVDLVVSTGPATATVPSVIGLPSATASSRS